MLALAALLVLAGVAALRLAWRAGRRGRTRRRLVLRWGGWLLLAGSLVPSMAASGADRGVALAIVVLMLAGLVLVLREGRREWLTPRRRRREREGRDEPLPAAGGGRGRLLARRIWIFCLGGPLAAAATLAIGLAMWLGLERAGVQDANILASALLAIPVIWALLAIVASIDLRLWLRTVAVTLPGLLAGLASLWLGGGMA